MGRQNFTAISSMQAARHAKARPSPRNAEDPSRPLTHCARNRRSTSGRREAPGSSAEAPGSGWAIRYTSWDICQHRVMVNTSPPADPRHWQTVEPPQNAGLPAQASIHPAISGLPALSHRGETHGSYTGGSSTHSFSSQQALEL